MLRLTLIFILTTIFSCNSSPFSEYEEVDLMKYGLPISVLAPKNVEIGKDDLGLIKGAWLKGDEYYVQIYSSNTTTTNLSKIKEEKKSEVQSGIYFSKIVEEDDHGFLFEKDIDGDIRYDFRHIKIRGGKEFVFQRGLIGNYTEEAVRNMYAAIQQ